ncbi:MAG: lytic transglycosylase domain-containing protein [Gemmatimonadetes bacterium]|nr:lytic transglycosylase domain-containing protein [Gemmatimonadota bacterium]
MTRRCGWVLLFACLAPQSAAAQSPATAAVPGWDPAIQSWHAALDARAALRDSGPTPVEVLRALNAELTLGRPERIGLMLQRYQLSDPQLESEKLALEAAGAYALKSYQRAAELFSAAAARTSGTARGILVARSGDAFERAGKPAAAAAQYRTARERLDLIGGWLSLREARVTADSSRAFRLVDDAPAAARRMVPLVRGEFFALAGDTARAVAVLAGAGFDGRAATLALASGDSSNARQLAYRALRAGDTTVANTGIELATGPLPPRTSAECLTLGRALRRRSSVEAARLVGQAVARGDESTGTLMLWGELLAESGNLPAASHAYRRAAAHQDAEAVPAELARARLLVRLRQPLAARGVLTRFIADHPAHSLTPNALFLMGDLGQDSLYRVLIERWPTHEYASQARLRLAARALARHDTAGGAAFYQAEVEARGSQQHAARYLLGAIAARRGDSAAAVNVWSGLAHDDSLGYYGSIARTKLPLGLPAIAPFEPAALPEDLARTVEELDLLERAGFAAEAAVLVSWAVSQVDADRGLELAQALAARGRSTQAISLGWKAVRTRTLNDVGVLRAIYPWPFHDVVAAEAIEFGLDPYLLAAVIRQESSFDPDARSRAGARGLMQVMPGTAREAARRMRLEWSDQLLRVPDANLHVGAAHLANLLRYYRGDPVPALAAYNAGRSPVERWRRVSERDPALFVERIPYPETRGYVRSVLRNWAIYRVLYPQDSALDSPGN